MKISFFGVIVPCVIMATCFYLLFTHEEPVEDKQPAPVQETVKPKQDYRLDRLRIIRDTDKRIVCYFDSSRNEFINCVLY